MRRSIIFFLFVLFLAYAEQLSAAVPCIKHAFVSGKADAGDASVVRPTDWNACHTIEDAAVGASKLASAVNAQTGTTYTVVDGDRGKLVTHTNASATAVTLPQAGASSLFISGWFADFQNRGAGTVTITPTTSTIDGAASVAITQNQGLRIFSDGTNYFTQRGVGAAAAGDLTEVQATSPITVTSGTGPIPVVACATCGITGSPLSQFAATTSAQYAGVINDESGTGLVILQTSPTIITPTIASFANATHNHSNAAGGGLVPFTSLSGIATPAQLSQTVNAQTGTTYTVLDGDRGKLVTHTNAAAIAVTLPQAGAGSAFIAGWYADFQNRGVGTVTITPTSSTIDDVASISLATDQGIRIFSDGTNYFTQRGRSLAVEADTLDTVADRGATTTGRNSFANSLRIEGTTAGRGIACYDDATDGPLCIGYTGGVANDVDYYRKLNSGKFEGVKDATGAIVFNTSQAGGGTAKAIAAPATPAAGYVAWYPESISKNWAVKDDAGVIKHGIQTRTATANNWIRSIAADGSTTISQPAIADLSDAASVVTPSSTNTLTNKTLDVEGTGNVLTTVSQVSWDVAGGSVAAPGLNGDTVAALAPTAVCTAGTTNTSLIRCTADFPDSDGDFSLQRSIFLPDDFTGTMDASFLWRAAATTGDAVWQIRTICIADAEVDDAAFNTASTVTDTVKGTTNQMNIASITGVIITGCAVSEKMHVYVMRNRTHASDTIAGVISLDSVRLKFRRAQ